MENSESGQLKRKNIIELVKFYKQTGNGSVFELLYEAIRKETNSPKEITLEAIGWLLPAINMFAQSRLPFDSEHGFVAADKKDIYPSPNLSDKSLPIAQSINIIAGHIAMAAVGTVYEEEANSVWLKAHLKRMEVDFEDAMRDAVGLLESSEKLLEKGITPRQNIHGTALEDTIIMKGILPYLEVLPWRNLNIKEHVRKTVINAGYEKEFAAFAGPVSPAIVKKADNPRGYDYR